MATRQRLGNTSLIVLIGAILLVLFVVTLITMSKQAKASSELKKQVIDQANKMVAAGLAVDASTLPSVKSAQINRQQTTQYSKDGISFSYPQSLKLKDYGSNYRELASDDRYFNSSVVPANQLLVKIRTDVRLSLSTLGEYKQQAPYAIKDELTLINNRQVLLITNQFENTTWQQAVIADSPQGPYHFVTVLPGNSGNASDTLQLILTTFKRVGS